MHHQFIGTRLLCCFITIFALLLTAAASGQENGPSESPPEDAPAKKLTDPFGDPLPAGAVRRIGTDRLRHASDAYSIDFLPDGKTVVSAGYDATIRFWQISDGKLVRKTDIQRDRPKSSLPGKKDAKIDDTALTRAIEAANVRRYATFPQPLLGAELSPDGKLLAGAGANGIIVLVDCEKGTEVRRFVPSDLEEIWGLAFSPDGKNLAFSGEYNTLAVQDLAFEKPPHKLQDSGEAYRVLIYLDDNHIAAGAEGIDIWDLEKGEISGHLGGETDVHALALSPDGKVLASGDANGLVTLWDPAKTESLHTLEAHEATIVTMAFSPDGESLVSGCAEGNLVFWDVDTGTYSASVQSAGTFNDLAYSPDGAHLGAAHAQILRLWDIESGKEMHAIERHRSEITDLVFSPDDSQIYSVSGDTLLRVWNVETGDCPDFWSGFPARISSVDVDSAGKRLIAGCWHLSLFDLETMEFEKTIDVEGDEIDSVAISPDGKHAVTSQVELVRLWDLETGEITHESRLHKNGVARVAWSPDGKLLAAGSADEKISLLSSTDGKLLHMLEGLDDGVKAVCFSSDSSKLAAVGSLERILIFDVELGEVAKTLPYKGSNPYGVAFSPDGKMLVTGNAAGQAFLYDIEAGEQMASWRAHESDVQAVAYSHDGKHVATGGLDGIILIWEVAALLQ